MDQSMAQTVILAGSTVAVVVWLLGVRAYARLSAEPGRYRIRVPVRSAGQEAFAELVRWATQEGRRLVSKGDRRVCVAQGMMQVEVELVQDTAGPALEVRTDLTAYRRGLLVTCGVIVFAVAPLVMAGLAGGLYFYAAPSRSPAVRWQALQILQCVHVLWPPFLITGQYSRIRHHLLDPIAGNLRALIDVAGR